MMRYKVWVRGERPTIVTDDAENEITAFEAAVNWCWNKCYAKLQELYDNEEIKSKDFRRELRQLNNWYKQIKAELSPAEMFYLFEEEYAYLRKVD